MVFSGAKYIRKHKFGHEIYNFAPYAGRQYGYARPVSGRINIERLGASPNENHVDGVLVVWTAPHHARGVVIVGWYRNARVYREYQLPPPGAKRKHKGDEIGYYVSAKAHDCRLLDVDARTFQVPHMGQSLIWYADSPAHDAFVRSVRKYIGADGAIPNRRNAKTPGAGWQHDIERRLAVERKAVVAVSEHYARLGYKVRSVEHERKGWDLVATLGRKEHLKIEVKGRIGPDIVAELTLNEYLQMQRHNNSYRICVVTNALTSRRTTHIFSYSIDSQAWETDAGLRLTLTEKTAATLSARS